MKKTYYYIFGVRAHPATSKTPGKLSLDFMIEYTDEDLSNTELAKMMIDNKAIKTEKDEAVRACDLASLYSEITAASLRSKVNLLSTHKINSEFKLDHQMLSMWVNSCNFDDVAKQKLYESRVNI